MKNLVFDTFTCDIGQTAHENWELLDKRDCYDYFFHLSSFSSCYVMVKTKVNLTSDIIITCAQMCKENTKYKNHRKVKVDYCSCDNLIRGSKVGEVFYKSKKKVRTVSV